MKFYMVVLALDTTTRRGSAALTRDGRLVGTFSGDALITHGERLPGDLLGLLASHGVGIGEVDLFGVASGPGSFTALRIGIASLQGFALANHRPLVGVSALDALNDSARVPLESGTSPFAGEDAVVAAWLDAQRGQVFSAAYKGRQVIDGPLVDVPGRVLAAWDLAPTLFIGDGALAYEPTIRDRYPDAQIARDVPPLAPAVARLAEQHVREHGPVPPDAIRPIYVRRSDAELARDRARS
jgi:tRNA threonylcarbamoyladenosine biosynthesis protein TsaB